MTEEQSERRSILEDRFWEAAARVAVVGGILLPLVGYSVRWLSLGLSSEPPQLALAISPARAATIGVEPFGLSLMLVFAIVRFDIFGFRSGPRSGPLLVPRSGWRWIVATAFRLVVVAIVAAIVIVFIQALIVYILAQPVASIPTGVGTLIAAPLLRAVVRRERAISLASIGPATAVLIVAAGVSSAIGPAAILDVSDYRFTDDAAVTDGRYATIGDADGWFYVRSCADPARTVVAVPAAFVRQITLAPGRVRAAQATLGQIIGEGRRPVGDPCSP
jgi:hypothetical protein